MKRIVLFLLLLATSSQADTNALLESLSPKLRQFLATNVAASNALSDTAKIQQAVRSITLFYFYTSDESVAPAEHFATSESSIMITLREDVEPIDEYLYLEYELINLSSQDRFQDVMRKAVSKQISKEGYAKEMIRIEFATHNKLKELVSKLKLSQKVVAASLYYKRLMTKPDNTFEEFFEDAKKPSTSKRNWIKEYETQYEVIQQHAAELSQPGYHRLDGP